MAELHIDGLNNIESIVNYLAEFIYYLKTEHSILSNIDYIELTNCEHYSINNFKDALKKLSNDKLLYIVNYSIYFIENNKNKGLIEDITTDQVFDNIYLHLFKLKLCKSTIKVLINL